MNLYIKTKYRVKNQKFIFRIFEFRLLIIGRRVTHISNEIIIIACEKLVRLKESGEFYVEVKRLSTTK